MMTGTVREGHGSHRGSHMRIFLAGVSCVGKTTIGGMLADLLHHRFFDLDGEVERFFGMPIERLQDSHLTTRSFRLAASKALRHVLALPESSNCVIALPPSGLMGGYWDVVKRTRDAAVVVLSDTPENILERITFYDIDSRPIQRILTPRERSRYLREIRQDIAYFSRSFQRADVLVDIAGCSPCDASRKVKDALMLPPSNESTEASEQQPGSVPDGPTTPDARRIACASNELRGGGSRSELLPGARIQRL